MTTVNSRLCTQTGSRRCPEPDLGQQVGHVAAYHHSLGHVTVDVQVKKVSPWGIPAKGPFLGSVPGSHGSTVATLSGLQLATLSSVPVSTLMPMAMAQLSDRLESAPRPSSLGWSPLQYLVRYGETLKVTLKSHPATKRGGRK